MQEGECVVVYPEGTITREPDLWPMTGKTGAARIALASGVPGDPGRPVGRAATSSRRTPSGRGCFPRKTDRT